MDPRRERAGVLFLKCCMSCLMSRAVVPASVLCVQKPVVEARLHECQDKVGHEETKNAALAHKLAHTKEVRQWTRNTGRTKLAYSISCPFICATHPPDSCPTGILQTVPPHSGLDPCSAEVVAHVRVAEPG
jgi:hypothetical protein